MGSGDTMKISFRNGVKSQQPVTPAQTEMKEFQRRKTPVFKTGATILIGLAILTAGVALYKRNTLYTYGIVSGSTAEVTAGFPTEIQTVLVSKGDVVKKGDVLFTQLSIEGEAQIRAAEVNLQTKMAEYDLIQSVSGPAEEGGYADPLANERELLRLKQQGTGIARERLQSEARYEQSRLKILYEAKRERYNNLRKLYELDAATLSQVKAAETEKKLRYNDYVLARDHYQQVLKANRIAEAEAQKEARKLESILMRDSIKTKTDYQSLLSEIETARTQLDQLKKRYGSATYTAPFDAIITDVTVTQGSVLNSGESILTSSSLSHLWVDVYVEAEKASLFTEDKEIRLYGGATRKSIPGTLSAKGQVQLRVPQLLSDKMPGITSAVYFNVMFENTGHMLPGNIVKVVVK